MGKAIRPKTMSPRDAANALADIPRNASCMAAPYRIAGAVRRYNRVRGDGIPSDSYHRDISSRFRGASSSSINIRCAGVSRSSNWPERVAQTNATTAKVANRRESGKRKKTSSMYQSLTSGIPRNALYAMRRRIEEKIGIAIAASRGETSPIKASPIPTAL